MPFSEEFYGLKKKYERLYSDSAKAHELAYREAFQKGIVTYRDKKFNFKFNGNVHREESN